MTASNSQQASVRPENDTDVQVSERPIHYMDKATAQQRAAHMLRTWLRHFHVAEDVSLNTNGSLTIYRDRSNLVVLLDIQRLQKRWSAKVNGQGDILDPRLPSQMSAVHAVTGLLGLGTPTFTPRAAPSDASRYEDSYLRTAAFRRCPDPEPDEVAKYQPVVERMCKWALHNPKMANVWRSMGIDLEDLRAMCHVWLMPFLFNSGFGTEGEVQSRLYPHLKQKLQEACKKLHQKSQDCNPGLRVERGQSTEEGTIRDCLEVIPVDEPGPASDYEAGSYLLSRPGMSAITMTVVEDVIPRLQVNGKVLTNKEMQDIARKVRQGVYTLSRVEVEEDPQEGREVVQSATKELADRLQKMTPEARRDTLAIAALNNALDPEVRRGAWAWCQKMGIDPVNYRVEVEMSRDRLAESFVPAGETFHKKAVKKVDEAVLQTIEAVRAEKMAEIRAKGSVHRCSNKACVTPNRTYTIDEIGVRIDRDRRTGMPKHARAQTYCKACRNIKKK